MKSNFSIVVWMMVVSIALKLGVFLSKLQFTNYERAALFANVFILMTGIFIGIRLFKRMASTPTSFLSDVKAGMRVAAMYAVFMCAFVYIYYSYIDANYFDLRLESQLALVEENGGDVEQARQGGKFVLSPFFQSTITLIGFLILGTFYASILTFFMRKVRGER